MASLLLFIAHAACLFHSDLASCTAIHHKIDAGGEIASAYLPSGYCEYPGFIGRNYSIPFGIYRRLFFHAVYSRCVEIHRREGYLF